MRSRLNGATLQPLVEAQERVECQASDDARRWKHHEVCGQARDEGPLGMVDILVPEEDAAQAEELLAAMRRGDLSDDSNDIDDGEEG